MNWKKCGFFKGGIRVCVWGEERNREKTASGQNFIPRTPEHKIGMLISTAICCRSTFFYETIKNLLSWWRSQWIVIKLYWLIKLTSGHIYWSNEKLSLSMGIKNLRLLGLWRRAVTKTTAREKSTHDLLPLTEVRIIPIQTKLKFYYFSHSEFRESRNPLSSWCYNFKPHYKIIIFFYYYTQSPESNPDWGENFRNCPFRPWGSPSLQYKAYRVLDQQTL